MRVVRIQRSASSVSSMGCAGFPVAFRNSRSGNRTLDVVRCTIAVTARSCFYATGRSLRSRERNNASRKGAKPAKKNPSVFFAGLAPLREIVVAVLNSSQLLTLAVPNGTASVRRGKGTKSHGRRPSDRITTPRHGGARCPLQPCGARAVHRLAASRTATGRETGLGSTGTRCHGTARTRPR